MNNKNPTAIVINRPLPGPSVHLRRKGAIIKMEDGSYCVTCMNENNHKFWILISRQTIRDLQEAVLKEETS